MPGVLDARDRDSVIHALAAGPLDVLVIGGGITGAGAALAAVKAATLAAVQLSGGPLEPADRTEILAAALRVLRS